MVVVEVVATDAFLPRVCPQHQSAAASRDLWITPPWKPGVFHEWDYTFVIYRGSMSSDFWAGYISGALGIIIGNPLDVIKVRLQAGHSRDASAQSQLSRFEKASSLVRGLCDDIVHSFVSGS
jgi:hypothetical protein